MKQNSKRHSVLRMTAGILLDNALAVVFGFLLLTMFGSVFHGAFYWIAILVTFFLFCFFVYHEGWTHGAADFNMVKHDHATEKKWKGELAGAFASVPTCLLALLALFYPAGAVREVFSRTYRIWNLPFQFLFDGLSEWPILYVMPVLAMIFAAALGYRLGYRQIRLSDTLVYAKQKEE